MNKITIHIKEPFFRAGKLYKWEGEYPTIGIGLHENYLNGDGVINITVRGNKKIWSIFKWKARSIRDKYGTNHTTRDGTRLVILPWRAFKEGE